MKFIKYNERDGNYFRLDKNDQYVVVIEENDSTKERAFFEKELISFCDYNGLDIRNYAFSDLCDALSSTTTAVIVTPDEVIDDSAEKELAFKVLALKPAENTKINALLESLFSSATLKVQKEYSNSGVLFTYIVGNTVDLGEFRVCLSATHENKYSNTRLENDEWLHTSSVTVLDGITNLRLEVKNPSKRFDPFETYCV